MNTQPAFDHSGSSFDSFLEEEGILDEVETAAIKRVIAWQLAEAMKAGKISKKSMAERMGTSQSAIARIESGRTLPSAKTLIRFAEATGSKIQLRLSAA